MVMASQEFRKWNAGSDKYSFHYKMLQNTVDRSATWFVVLIVMLQCNMN